MNNNKSRRIFFTGFGLALILLTGCHGGGGGSGGSSSTSPGSGSSTPPTLFFNDPTNPTLATTTMPDGSQATFFGAKDAQGLPTSLTSMAITSAPTDPTKLATISFDNQRRPSMAVLGTGESIQFQYVSATEVDLVFKLANGQVLGPFPYNPVTGSLSASTQTVTATATTTVSTTQTALALATTTTTMSGTTSTSPYSGSGKIQVTCAQLPLDGSNVTGTFTPAGSNFNSIQMPITSIGAGLFQYSFPINPFSIAANSSLLTALQDFATTLDDNVISPGCQSLEQGGWNIVTIGALIAQISFYCPQCGAVAALTLPALVALCEFHDVLLNSPALVQNIATLLGDITGGGEITVVATYTDQQLPASSSTINGSDTVGPTVSLDFSVNQCVSLQINPTVYYANAAGPVAIEVTRTGSTPVINSITSSVSYAGLTGGTAVNGKDFTLTPGVLTFNPGQTSATFNVQVLDNPSRLSSVTAISTLLNPVNGRLEPLTSFLPYPEAILNIGPEPLYNLTIAVIGTGTGTVISNPVGINCGVGGTVCSAQFPSGTNVQLMALAGQNSIFSQFSPCTYQCSIILNSNTTVQAEFDLFFGSISVSPTGCTSPGCPLWQFSVSVTGPVGTALQTDEDIASCGAWTPSIDSYTGHISVCSRASSGQPETDSFVSTSYPYECCDLPNLFSLVFVRPSAQGPYPMEYCYPSSPSNSSTIYTCTQ